MKSILTDKRWIGIFSAIAIGAVFIGISLAVMNFLHGTPWFIFSSILRILFGIAILILSGKIYGRSPKELLAFSNGKAAFISGIGFLLYFVCDLFIIAAGFGGFVEIPIGILLSKVFLQQITTGFYEELNYRFLILEGYQYGKKSAGRKIIYALISFVLFGLLHVVTGWDTYRFLQTGAIGFAFAVIFLNSGNLILPMILHAIYDICAHLTNYINWNDSAIYTTLNSLFEVVIAVMFLVSFVLLFRKEKQVQG